MSRSYSKKKYQEKKISKVKQQIKKLNSRRIRRYSNQFSFLLLNNLDLIDDIEFKVKPDLESYYFAKSWNYSPRRKRIDEIIIENIHQNTITRDRYKKDIVGLFLDIISDIQEEQKTFIK